MIQLNEFRKRDSSGASLITRQIFDNCCMEAGIEGDGKSMIKRVNNILGDYMTLKNQSE